MSREIVESLPNQVLDTDTVESLEEHDKIVQAVPVRGLFVEEKPAAFQILLNVPDRGLLGLHIDPYAPNSDWEIVFDSQNVRGEDLDDTTELYHRAHEALLDHSPELEGNFFENTPDDSDIGLMDDPDREETD